MRTFRGNWSRFFYKLEALAAAQPMMSKQRRTLKH